MHKPNQRLILATRFLTLGAPEWHGWGLLKGVEGLLWLNVFLKESVRVRSNINNTRRIVVVQCHPDIIRAEDRRPCCVPHWRTSIAARQTHSRSSDLKGPIMDITFGTVVATSAVPPRMNVHAFHFERCRVTRIWMSLGERRSVSLVITYKLMGIILNQTLVTFQNFWISQLYGDWPLVGINPNRKRDPEVTTLPMPGYVGNNAHPEVHNNFLGRALCLRSIDEAQVPESPKGVFWVRLLPREVRIRRVQGPAFDHPRDNLTQLSICEHNPVHFVLGY